MKNKFIKTGVKHKKISSRTLQLLTSEMNEVKVFFTSYLVESAKKQTLLN